MIVAILGLKVSGIPMMTMMGYGSAIMVAVTMLASITLLPAMLGVVKHRVNSARVPFVKPQPAYSPDAQVRPLGQRGSSPVPSGTAAQRRWSSASSPSRSFSMHLGLRRRGQRRSATRRPARPTT